MDITRDNFIKQWPHIEESIRTADFIAFDTELTGLHESGEEERYTDTLNERYDRLKRSASKFIVCQFGVCTFHIQKDEAGNSSYIAKPFNFNVFPTQMVSSSVGSLDAKPPDLYFQCNSSSLDFLASHKFDFNKWIKKGLPFITLQQLNSMQFAQKEISTRPNINPTDEKSIEFLKQTQDAIKTWLQDSNERRLVLHAPTAYYRRLIYEHVKDTYNGFVSAEKMDRQMTVKRLTIDEKTKRESTQKELANIPLNFCKVIDLLIDVKKPMIGHNCFLDLVHLFHHFVGTLSEASFWVRDVKKAFPLVIDTKMIAILAPGLSGHLPSTGLESIADAVNRHPFSSSGPNISFAPDFNNYSDHASAHEAGYDAYLTGMIFLRLTYRILQDAGIHVENPEDIILSQILAPYYNILQMMRSPLAFFPLDGRKLPLPEVEPTRFVIRIHGDYSYTVHELMLAFTKIEKGTKQKHVPRIWRVLEPNNILIDMEEAELQQYVLEKAKELPGVQIKRYLTWFYWRMSNEFEEAPSDCDDEDYLEDEEENEVCSSDHSDGDYDQESLSSLRRSLHREEIEERVAKRLKESPSETRPDL